MCFLFLRRRRRIAEESHVRDETQQISRIRQGCQERERMADKSESTCRSLEQKLRNIKNECQELNRAIQV